MRGESAENGVLRLLLSCQQPCPKQIPRLALGFVAIKIGCDNHGDHDTERTEKESPRESCPELAVSVELHGCDASRNKAPEED
jgi:hypothetical protein